MWVVAVGEEDCRPHRLSIGGNCAEPTIKPYRVLIDNDGFRWGKELSCFGRDDPDPTNFCGGLDGVVGGVFGFSSTPYAPNPRRGGVFPPVFVRDNQTRQKG